MQRVAGREDERDQQDRAELADPARRQQVGAELGLQLAVVAQDRDQRADRRRRHRRPRVEEGEDDAGRGEGAADRVGECDREQPAPGAELERFAADPLEVDLVAGEEEEHPQAEVGEEFDEAVGPGKIEDFGADDDPQQQLDDDNRRREARGNNGDGDRRDGGDRDDDEEGVGVDVDQGVDPMWTCR